MVIDTSFDFRKDTPDYPKKDPDVHSPTLRRYHKLLWSKALPGGTRYARVALCGSESGAWYEGSVK